MLVSQSAPARVEDLDGNTFGFGMSPLNDIQRRQAAHAGQRIRMVFSQCATPKVDGTFELRLRLFVKPQAGVGVADRVTDCGFDGWMIVELATDVGGGPIQGRPDLEIRIRCRAL